MSTTVPSIEQLINLHTILETVFPKKTPYFPMTFLKTNISKNKNNVHLPLSLFLLYP